LRNITEEGRRLANKWRTGYQGIWLLFKIYQDLGHDGDDDDDDDDGDVASVHDVGKQVSHV
jgi:hypothetical protein